MGQYPRVLRQRRGDDAGEKGTFDVILVVFYLSCASKFSNPLFQMNQKIGSPHLAPRPPCQKKASNSSFR